MKALREATRGFVGVTDVPAVDFIGELIELYPNVKVSRVFPLLAFLVFFRLFPPCFPKIEAQEVGLLLTNVVLNRSWVSGETQTPGGRVWAT